MKFIVASILVLLLAGSAQAGKNTCSVSPNPVPEGSDYTISASGLKPVVLYYVKVTDQSEHFGHHPVTLEYSDEFGNFSVTLNTNMPPRDSVFAGDSPSVRIYPESGGGTSSSCKFSVV